MSCSLVLLALIPGAPVPKAPPPPPPPIEVFAKHYVQPPRFIVVGGQQQQINVDDGHYIEVTIWNTSKEAVSFDSRHELGDLVYVKVTNEKGIEVSQAGYHLLLLCSSKSMPVELKPGDSAKVIAHLLQDWSRAEESRKPGKYTARVVFEGGKIRAESAATFELEIVK